MTMTVTTKDERLKLRGRNKSKLDASLKTKKKVGRRSKGGSRKNLMLMFFFFGGAQKNGFAPPFFCMLRA